VAVAPRRHLAHGIDAQVLGRLHGGAVLEQLGAVRLPDLLEQPAHDPPARHRVGVEDQLVGHLGGPFAKSVMRPRAAQWISAASAMARSSASSEKSALRATLRIGSSRRAHNSAAPGTSRAPPLGIRSEERRGATAAYAT